MQQLEDVARLYLTDHKKMFRFVSGRFRFGKDRAEDVVQETFVLAIRKIDNYDPQLGTLKKWVYGIAYRVAIKSYNGAKRTPASLDDVPENADPISGNIEDVAMLKDISLKVQEDLERAPPSSQSQKILRFWLEGNSEREIGRRLGISRYKTKLSLEDQLYRWQKLYDTVK